MNPYLVISPNEYIEDEKSYTEWCNAFNEINDTFEVDFEKYDYLTNRLGKAFTLCGRRTKRHSGTSLNDRKEFENLSYIDEQENLQFDGDYPFFNDDDIKLGYKVFTKKEMVLIQLGLDRLVEIGAKEEFNYRPLIRKGLIYQMNHDYVKACNCFENIPFKEIKERYLKCKEIIQQEQKNKLDAIMIEYQLGNYNVDYLTKLASEESMEGKALLGFMQVKGQGCQQNVDEGFENLNNAVYFGIDNAKKYIVDLYAEGYLHEYIDEEDVVDMCKYLANIGNKDAIVHIQNGFGNDTREKALRRRIEKNDVVAMRMLGEIYLDEEKTEEASKLFFTASELGDMESSMYLAKTCEEVYSVEFATQYYEEAAKQGSIEAILWLGDHKLKSTDMSFFDEVGETNSNVTKEHKEQFKYYLEAANKGDVQSMLKIAQAYSLGYPIQKDLKLAFEYSHKAYDLGSPRASYFIGKIYEKGAFGKVKGQEIIKWFEIGAKKLDVSCISKLYTIYSHGYKEVKPNVKKANYYMYLLNANNESN